MEKFRLFSVLCYYSVFNPASPFYSIRLPSLAGWQPWYSQK